LKRLCLIFILAFSAAAAAKEALKEPAKEALKVALFDKLPFAYKEGKEMKGFHYMVAQAIADRMGVKLIAKLVPIRRAIELLRQGSVDIVIMTDQTSLEEMKTKKAFLMSANTLIYTRPDHIHIQSKSDLGGRMCRIAGGCMELDDVKDIRWSDLKSYEQCLDVLLLGRVDGVCGTIAFQAAMNKHKVGSDQISTYAISDKSVWVHALPVIDEKRWKEIVSSVESLIKDGSVDYWAKKSLKP
jgi:ABC-type amino acid transport substrate-binding protein